MRGGPSVYLPFWGSRGGFRFGGRAVRLTVTRTRTRIASALVVSALVVGASVALASPAAAVLNMTQKFEVLIGSTWTLLPPASQGYVYTQVPAGVRAVRVTVENNGDEIAIAHRLYAGSRTNAGGDGYGVDKDDCPGYDAGTDTVLIPAGATIVCSTTMDFLPGNRGVYYGLDTVGATSGLGWSTYLQGLLYRGIANNIVGTALVTDSAGTFVASTSPSLQLFNAGETPQVKFSFDNAGSTADTTGITYSSTSTASIASACPTLATTYVAVPVANGSGDCTVNLLPASQSPQTVTITASGTSAFGVVSQSITFTYAATPASCTTAAGTYKQGDTVTVTCVGFEPGLTANAVLHSAPVAVGSFSTGSGAFSFNFIIPSTFDAGTHTVVINLGTFSLAITPSFLITAALAATGTEAALPLGIAGLLLALGVALLVYRRRQAARTS